MKTIVSQLNSAGFKDLQPIFFISILIVFGASLTVANPLYAHLFNGLTIWLCSLVIQSTENSTSTKPANDENN